jgi:ubiquinone/menaquinone biosynthesis C-methylase UbiE
MTTIETTGADYEYRALMATCWDTLRGDTTDWDDQVLFRRLAQERGGATLDVGCGSGRLLLDLRAHGIDADGVDISPEMLAILREKAAARGIAVTVHEQAMETLDLPRQYRTVLVPSSSFQLLTDAADASRAMARLVAQLEPDGLLIMPFMTLWQPGEPQQYASREPRTATLPDGTQVLRWSSGTFDPETGCESTEDRYELHRDGVAVAREIHRRSPATRSYTQDGARVLYEAAGLVDITVKKAFSDVLAAPDDRTFTLYGTRR